jgi:RNA-directed DNA polymerase
VKQNKEVGRVDSLSIADYQKWIYAHWRGIQTGLEQGYYCPLPVKRIETSKLNALGIPNVNDRVIQQAICQALQP